MRFPLMGLAALWGMALGLAFAELAAGQEQPQWVPISDSVVAKVAGDNKKASSFERETAGVVRDSEGRRKSNVHREP